MGAWGEGPFENDTSGDWMYKISAIVDGAIERVRDNFDYDSEVEEARAAIGVMVALIDAGALSPDPDILHDAQEWLAQLLESEFITPWRSRRTIKSAIKRQLEDVERIARAAERRRSGRRK